jgi:hypothetical protein
LIADAEGSAIEARIEGVSAAPEATPFRPTYLMERISLAIETTRGMSVRNIQEVVTGKKDLIKFARDRG